MGNKKGLKHGAWFGRNALLFAPTKGHSMKSVLTIINKSWEADAALSAIFNDDICHPSLDYKKAGGIFTLQRNILDFPRERH